MATTSAAEVAAPAALSCEGVTKSFGTTRALIDVDLRIEIGQSVGLLGPNGAGKSTLMALAAGLRRPDDGRVRIAGDDPVRVATRRGIGMAPQINALPATLRVGEVVGLVRAHHVDPVGAVELLRLVGLDDLTGRRCGELSGGQQRRLSVALALVGRPRMLLLDEPTAGLDVHSREVVEQVVARARADGTTVLLSSHDLRDVERGCDRVVVMNGGRVVADDDLASFRARSSVRWVTARTTAPEAVLTDLPGVVQVRPGAPVGLASTDSDATLRALLALDPPAHDVLVCEADLEHVLRTTLRESEPVR